MIVSNAIHQSSSTGRPSFTICHANGCQTLHTDFQILITFVFAFHLVVKKKNILRKNRRDGSRDGGTTLLFTTTDTNKRALVPMIANIIQNIQNNPKIEEVNVSIANLFWTRFRDKNEDESKWTLLVRSKYYD